MEGTSQLTIQDRGIFVGLPKNYYEKFLAAFAAYATKFGSPYKVRNDADYSDEYRRIRRLCVEQVAIDGMKVYNGETHITLRFGEQATAVCAIPVVPPPINTVRNISDVLICTYDSVSDVPSRPNTLDKVLQRDWRLQVTNRISNQQLGNGE